MMRIRFTGLYVEIRLEIVIFRSGKFKKIIVMKELSMIR